MENNNKDAMLLVLPWSPDLPGGVSVVVSNLARMWQAAHVPVSILVSDWPSRRAKRDKSGVHSLRLAIIGEATLFGLTKSILFSPIVLFRTLALLKQHDIGAVYFHYANLDAFGVALLKRLGLYKGRFILCFHGTDVRKPKNGLTLHAWNFMFSRADAVTACSNALARGVEATYGLPAGSVLTVYNGVNTEIFSREAGCKRGRVISSTPKYNAISLVSAVSSRVKAISRSSKRLHAYRPYSPTLAWSLLAWTVISGPHSKRGLKRLDCGNRCAS